jgi:anti-anti-sigma factor
MARSSFTSVEQLPAAVVVHVLPDSIRKSEVDGICAGVDEARVTAPDVPFVMDMANVRFMGSLAVGVLVGLNKEFVNRGQRLIFVNLERNLHDAIKVTHLHKVLEILPDVAAALRSVEAAG